MNCDRSMKNGTRPSVPFSWKRVIRGAAISMTALAGVLAVPLGKAIYWSNHNAVYHAQQERAEYNRISSDALARTTTQMSPHGWDANGTAYGKVGTIDHHMTEVEYQRRMAAHELTLGDVNRHNRGE